MAVASRDSKHQHQQVSEATDVDVKHLPQHSPLTDDTASDEWTVVVFDRSDGGRQQRDLYDRLSDAFMVAAWNARFRDWYGAVRALARLLRGLEQSDIIERTTTRGVANRPRRVWRLTGLGTHIVAALTAAENGESPSTSEPSRANARRTEGEHR